MNEYVEPTNEQLANFLIVYIPSQMGLDLHPSASMVQFILESDPEVRERALAYHRKFREQIKELDLKMKAGELPCAHIRSNGKPCPNRNQPGSYYCGLHIDDEEN